MKFFGYLADFAGTRIKELKIEHPVVLREILPPAFPEGNIIILINQKVGSLDSQIEDQDSIVLMPVLSGG